jgi:hypothetical protein
VKGDSNEKLRKLMNDPTLEGKDENKVGRFQRKIGRTEKPLEKTLLSRLLGGRSRRFVATHADKWRGRN